MTRTAYTGAAIFDGTTLHETSVLLAEDGLCRGITAAVPEGYSEKRLEGGILAPGFVDLQVNGGGGVMLNDETTPQGVRRIADAHAATGTLGLLPTLITDTPERSRAAVGAVAGAIAEGVPGVLGIHLEGPHLSLARKGAHDPALIRAMAPEDEAFLIEAAGRLPNVLSTVAPESVTPDQIARLTAAGVIVSLGHTDCTYAMAEASFAAGATCVTHLFNAMSQLGNREPGLVGATLQAGGASAGLIADDIHVHAATIGTALAAKQGPGRIFLVTDAMSTVGSDITEFTLNGRRILRRDGRLTLADGTLAGADLDMPRAISVMAGRVGVDLAQALSMATSVPAGLLRDAQGHGGLTDGAPLRAVHLTRGPSGEIGFARRIGPGV